MWHTMQNASSRRVFMAIGGQKQAGAVGPLQTGELICLHLLSQHVIISLTLGQPHFHLRG